MHPSFLRIPNERHFIFIFKRECNAALKSIRIPYTISSSHKKGPPQRVVMKRIAPPENLSSATNIIFLWPSKNVYRTEKPFDKIGQETKLVYYGCQYRSMSLIKNVKVRETQKRRSLSLISFAPPFHKLELGI